MTTPTFIPPETVDIHMSYCHEHISNHWLDDHENCYGDDFSRIRKALLSMGYYYAGHKGGGWYRYNRKYNAHPTPLDWQMLADERQAEMFDNRDLDPIDF